jgi:Ca2+-binding EF-hand superfamily protein
MDSSGDGKLGEDEIKFGFEKILNENVSLDECKNIIDAIDMDKNGYIDYRDFLIGSIDFSYDSMKGYISKAKDCFFETNPTIDIQSLVD